MKELVEKVEKLIQEKDDLGNFGPGGPGDEEEKKKLLDFFEKVRNSDTCRTMREKDFKSKITDYKSSMILRLPTFESIQKMVQNFLIHIYTVTMQTQPTKRKNLMSSVICVPCPMMNGI